MPYHTVCGRLGGAPHKCVRRCLLNSWSLEVCSVVWVGCVGRCLQGLRGGKTWHVRSVGLSVCRCFKVQGWAGGMNGVWSVQPTICVVWLCVPGCLGGSTTKGFGSWGRCKLHCVCVVDGIRFVGFFHLGAVVQSSVSEAGAVLLSVTSRKGCR
jgi:hypothetical protein